MRDLLSEAKRIESLNRSLFGAHENFFRDEKARIDKLLGANSSIFSAIEAVKKDSLASLVDANGAKWFKELDSLKNQYLDLFKSRSILEKSLPINQLYKRALVDIESIRPVFEISKKIAESLPATALANLEKLSKPYQGIDQLLDSHASLVDSIKSLTTLNDTFRHVQLPIIDNTTALAISRMWGEEGVYSQLVALGISENELVDDTKTEDQIDRWTAISIIIALLMFLYQLADSHNMEKRLADKIETKSNETQGQIKSLEKLLEVLVNSEQRKIKQVEYVVKARNALIRELPKNSSKVMAEIFPNQVVGLIDSEGKWIEVKYYDWLHQEYRTGWVLKKYLKRMQPLTN